MIQFTYINLYDLAFNSDVNGIHNIKTQYMGLLSELTSSPDITVELFLENISKIHATGTIIVAVAGSKETNDLAIVGSGTVFIETKLIRGGRPAAHIEDIVVHPSFRGKGIATGIVNNLLQYSKQQKCYKVMLDSRVEAMRLYEKCGFVSSRVDSHMYMYIIN
jgi:ribosomal protein S18 acetylase RimI-like enzyme